MGFWKPIAKAYAVPWDTYLEWELWQVAAALSLDKRAPTVEEEALLENPFKNARRPSPNRRG